MTQTWLTGEVQAADRLTYEAVFCLACSRPHFICTATGRALGDNSEMPTSIRGPVFPPKQIQLCHERAAATGIGAATKPAIPPHLVHSRS